jgi:hypothetical protein
MDFYKEKYEQIFKRAKEIFYNPGFGYGKEIVGEIFPELKEPKDEIIRKEILQFLRIHNGWYKEWIDWMEKQGRVQQQPKQEWSEEDEYQINTILHGLDLKRGIYKKEGNKVEEERYNTRYNWLKSLKTRCKGGVEPAVEHDKKIEPKFKVGDWISCYYSNCKVKEINDEGYIAEDADGNKISILFENEKFYHLWTIEDAKDGEVLSCPNEAGDRIVVFIFKQSISPSDVDCYCCLDANGVFDPCLYNGYIGKVSCDDYTYTPATKEERDTLFTRMKEAGYIWNEEKLKLEK